MASLKALLPWSQFFFFFFKFKLNNMIVEFLITTTKSSNIIERLGLGIGLLTVDTIFVRRANCQYRFCLTSICILKCQIKSLTNPKVIFLYGKILFQFKETEIKSWKHGNRSLNKIDGVSYEEDKTSLFASVLQMVKKSCIFFLLMDKTFYSLKFRVDAFFNHQNP